MPRPYFGFSLLRSHAQRLPAIAQSQNLRLRDLAEQVQIKERQVQSIISDLALAGYVDITRVGRRSEYRVNRDATLRIPFREDLTVEHVLAAVSIPEAKG